MTSSKKSTSGQNLKGPILDLESACSNYPDCAKKFKVRLKIRLLEKIPCLDAVATDQSCHVLCFAIAMEKLNVKTILPKLNRRRRITSMQSPERS